ncbi:EamA family transporter [Massilia sp. ST3]|uniref:EamA family transporter n=1 Tax=Massilia sp. ST3 TaxID=2824903 RepID=UPI001B821D7C|nr:EamA family transporter [Massilia sp. ST3]MBQ5947105.1 EamA family transporter [Massilia sp. ST3]
MPAGGVRAFGPGLAILASMVSVNAGAAWAKGLFPVVGSAGVTALRVGLAALMLLAAVRPWRTLPNRQDAGNLAIYGVMLGLMNLLIYGAFSRIPIGIAVAIEVTGPLAVVIMSSRRARDFAWVACAALGLALLLPLEEGSKGLDPLGVAYALGAAFCWAMYIVFGKRVSSLKGTEAVAWGMLAASLFAVPVGVAQAGALLFTPAMLAGGFLVALLSSAIPYTLEMMALARLPRRVFGILVSAGPALAALAGFVMLGERLTGLQWGAIFLVIFASAGAAATAGRGSE